MRINRWTGFITLACLALGLLALGNRLSSGQPPAAKSEQAASPPIQRYQISAWSRPAATRDTGGFIAPTNGAYILDTQSGKVWLISEGEKPKLLGSAE
jgi:hypothetical protein